MSTSSSSTPFDGAGLWIPLVTPFDHEDEQLATLATVAVAAPALPRMIGVSGYHLGCTTSARRDGS